MDLHCVVARVIVAGDAAMIDLKFVQELKALPGDEGGYRQRLRGRMSSLWLVKCADCLGPLDCRISFSKWPAGLDTVDRRRLA